MKKILVGLVAFSSMYFSNVDAWQSYDYKSNHKLEKHHKQHKKNNKQACFDNCSLTVETTNTQIASVMISVVENTSSGKEESNDNGFFKSSSSSQQMVERQFQSLDELETIFEAVAKNYKNKKGRFGKFKRSKPKSFFDILIEPNFETEEGYAKSKRDIEIKIVSRYTEADIYSVLSKHIKCPNIIINGVPFVSRNNTVNEMIDEDKETNDQQIPVVIRNLNQDIIDTDNVGNSNYNDRGGEKNKYWESPTKDSIKIEKSVDSPDSSVTFRFENKMSIKDVNENVIRYAKITGDILSKKLGINVNCVWNTQNNEFEVYATGKNSCELNKKLSIELSRLHNTVSESLFQQTANTLAPSCSLSKLLGKECNIELANFSEYKKFLNTFRYEPKLLYIAKGSKER